MEILYRRQAHNTREHLIKIYQPKSQIERARQHIAVGHRNHKADAAKDDVE